MLGILHFAHTNYRCAHVAITQILKTIRENNMKILLVLTSHDKLGNTGKKTGFWLEELAAPYYTFIDAGAEVTLASPQGGAATTRSEK